MVLIFVPIDFLLNLALLAYNVCLGKCYVFIVWPGIKNNKN